MVFFRHRWNQKKYECYNCETINYKCNGCKTMLASQVPDSLCSPCKEKEILEDSIRKLERQIETLVSNNDKLMIENYACRDPKIDKKITRNNNKISKLNEELQTSNTKVQEYGSECDSDYEGDY